MSSINGVNNSGSNAGLYASSAALVGAGAGASAAYLTKPYLKNGAPTDSFLKEITNNEVKQAKKLVAKLDKIKTAEELQNFIKCRAFIKDIGVAEKLAEQITAENFESFKSPIKEALLKTKEFITPDRAKTMFEQSWDATSKKFVHNAENITEEGFSVVKNAAKNIQGKYAMMFGAIGASVLGLTTLLLSSIGKKESPEVAMENNPQA